MDTFAPDYAIKLSARNFGFEDGQKDRAAVRGVLHLMARYII